jgi:hypothetical protein
MKKDNDEVLAGKFAFTARSSCKPAGVPGFDVLLGGALFILQSPIEVAMIFSGNAEVRHIRLNASHSANPKPSWYGESVGYYEGDTLVVDTIGLNDRTFIDNYRTPHTDKLHVTERWRLIEESRSGAGPPLATPAYVPRRELFYGVHRLRCTTSSVAPRAKGDYSRDRPRRRHGPAPQIRSRQESWRDHRPLEAG